MIRHYKITMTPHYVNVIAIYYKPISQKLPIPKAVKKITPEISPSFNMT